MFYLAGHWNLAKKELSLSCKPRSLPKPPAYRGRPSVFQRNFTTTAGAELGALDLVGSWFWCIHLHHFKGDNFYCVFLDGSFGSERSKSKIVQVYRFLMSLPVPKWFCISGWWDIWKGRGCLGHQLMEVCPFTPLFFMFFIDISNMCRLISVWDPKNRWVIQLLDISLIQKVSKSVFVFLTNGF